MTEKHKYENRKHPRIDTNLVVEVQYKDVDEFVSQYAVNISQGGLFVQSREIYPKGTLLNFEIKLLGGTPAMKGRGVVIWSCSEGDPDKGPPGMGIKFTAMDAQSKALLRKLIEEKKRQNKQGHTTGDFALASPSQTLCRADRLVDETDPRVIASKACEILTDRRGYFNAWIVLFDDSGQVSALAESRVGERFGKMSEKIRQEGVPACISAVLDKMDIVSLYDPPEACPDCPLAPDYAKRGAFSAPLHHGDRVFGAIVSSTDEHTSLDDDERSLFRGFARAVSYALYKAGGRDRFARPDRQGEAEERNAALQKKILQLKEMRASGVELNERLKKKLNRLLEKLSEIEAEKTAAEKELERSKTNYAAANAANKALEQKVKQVLINHAEADAEKTELQKQVDRLKRDLAEAQTRTGNADPGASGPDGQDHSAALAAARSEAAELSAQNRNLLDKIKRAKEKVLVIEDKNQKLTEKLIRRKEKIAGIAKSFAALKEHEARLVRILDGLPYAIIVYSFSGEISEANAAACKLTGYSRGELVGAPIEKIEEVKDAADQNARLIAAGALMYEALVTDKDGKKTPVKVRGRVVSSDGAGVIQIVLRPLKAGESSSPPP